MGIVEQSIPYRLERKLTVGWQLHIPPPYKLWITSWYNRNNGNNRNIRNNRNNDNNENNRNNKDWLAYYGWLAYCDGIFMPCVCVMHCRRRFFFGKNDVPGIFMPCVCVMHCSAQTGRCYSMKVLQGICTDICKWLYAFPLFPRPPLSSLCLFPLTCIPSTSWLLLIPAPSSLLPPSSSLLLPP